MQFWEDAIKGTNVNKMNVRFGMNFSIYINACHKNGQDVKGRPMMGLIAVKNQYDRMMGRAITVHQFQMLELKSFNIALPFAG